MKIQFNKYHANGNDFILILSENLEKKYCSSKIISSLCSRHTGVGADGLFIISPSDKNDFCLDYYNSDGSWETLCANGSRCAAQFMYSQGRVDSTMCFEAGDGLHRAKIFKTGGVSMSLKSPEYKSEHLSPFGVGGYFVDSGARHFVCESENLDDDYVLEMGRKIRFAPVFLPAGINVNFYRLTNNNSVEIKTYEKGVEQIMLSCASGSAAVVFHLAQINALVSPAITCSAGGGLMYVFDDVWAEFWSKGPAEFVFNGEFSLVNIP